MSDRINVRVLYLSYDGLTDPLGQSQILPYLVGLEAKGFEFTIISFEKSRVFDAARAEVDARISGKKIKWVPLRYHKNPPVLSTLFDVSLLWRTVLREHKRKPFSIIHCRSYVTSLVGLRMKRKMGIRFIFDMRGFWADERVEGSLWNVSNPIFRIIYNFFKKKEKEYLKEADHVISLTENAKNEILSWKIETAPITVIPTCVDLDLFDPSKIKRDDQNNLRAKLGITSVDFVLLYLGSWGTWYLTKEMLSFFSEVKQRQKNAKFLIVTTDKVDLTNYPNQADVILAYAPRNLVPLYISLASVSVFFIQPSFSKKASSATKMGEIMAMNVPVITNKGWGDAELIIKEAKAGIVVNGFTFADFKECLSELSQRQDHNGTKTFFQSSLSLSNGVLAYEKVFNYVLRARDAR